MVKNLPAMQETWVQTLGQEDPLEKEMAPHSSILAWEIPWTEKPRRLQSVGSQICWTQLNSKVTKAGSFSCALHPEPNAYNRP